MTELELIFDEYDKQQRENQFRMMEKVQRDLLFNDAVPKDLVYHDTIPISEEKLPEAREKASIQKGIVLDFFRQRFSMSFTPAEVHEILEHDGHKILLTSVRRSITNLTKENKLIKCDYSESKKGAYGALNRVWKYNTGYIPCINPQK